MTKPEMITHRGQLTVGGKVLVYDGSSRASERWREAEVFHIGDEKLPTVVTPPGHSVCGYYSGRSLDFGTSLGAPGWGGNLYTYVEGWVDAERRVAGARQRAYTRYLSEGGARSPVEDTIISHLIALASDPAVPDLEVDAVEAYLICVARDKIEAVRKHWQRKEAAGQ